MFEERDAKAPKQGEFRVATDHLPTGAAGTFYRKLDETLQNVGFPDFLNDMEKWLGPSPVDPKADLASSALITMSGRPGGESSRPSLAE